MNESEQLAKLEFSVLGVLALKAAKSNLWKLG